MINEIVNNKILICGLCAWAVAQILKFCINLAVHKKLDFSRLFGDGGMPSAHSATVTSVALICGLIEGFNSSIFAISSIVAIIVMHDAMGVRLETGKQAKLINEIMRIFENMEELAAEFSDEKLKELVGHTPLQVIAGFIVGILVAIFFYFVVV